MREGEAKAQQVRVAAVVVLDPGGDGRQVGVGDAVDFHGARAHVVGGEHPTVSQVDRGKGTPQRDMAPARIRGRGAGVARAIAGSDEDRPGRIAEG